MWTPFGNVRGDVYSWTDARDPNDPPKFIADDTIARGMAAGRLALLLPVRRPHRLGVARDRADRTDHRAAEPVDQRRTPDEDARSLIFDDTLLFDIDKFSGYDRLETGTRANVGMQYTLQSSSGLYARAVFGQSFHLAGENAYVDPGNLWDR